MQDQLDIKLLSNNLLKARPPNECHRNPSESSDTAKLSRAPLRGVGGQNWLSYVISRQRRPMAALAFTQNSDNIPLSTMIRSHTRDLDILREEIRSTGFI
jgi:hypothetical protein